MKDDVKAFLDSIQGKGKLSGDQVTRLYQLYNLTHKVRKNRSTCSGCVARTLKELRWWYADQPHQVTDTELGHQVSDNDSPLPKA